VTGTPDGRKEVHPPRDPFPLQEMLINSQRIAGLCIEAALEKKAVDLEILDLSAVTVFADYFVIMSGTSTRQVKAIAEEIEETLSRHKVEPDHIEGETEGRWILMDYGDTIVHVFLDTTREYYNLDRLWGDAPRRTPEDFPRDDDGESER